MFSPLTKNLIVVLKLIFLQKIPIFAFITRLPDCKYSANFTLIYEHEYFNGTIGQTITGPVSRDECSAYCLSDKTCVFYNHKIDETECQLMTSHVGNRIIRTGWRHATTDYLQYARQGPLCEFIEMQCTSEDVADVVKVCKDTCVSPGFVCEALTPIIAEVAKVPSIHVNYPKENLVDGDINTSWGTASASSKHSVVLDLKRTYSIYLIRIVNHLQDKRLQKMISVYVSNKDKNSGYVTVSQDKIMKNGQLYRDIYMKYDAHPVVGRWVKVERKGSSIGTAFGEIMVFGFD